MIGLLIAASVSVALAQRGGGDRIPTVIVTAAQVKSFPLEVEALGNAFANESIEVRAKITATVNSINFTEGQQVEKGEVLITLEDSQPLAAVATARANLIDASAQYKRSSELIRSNAVSQSQLDQIEATRDAAQAALNAAQARLEETVIRAPFSGRLGLRRVSMGSLVSPQTIVTTLDDTSVVKVDFAVPEIFLSRLSTGLPVIAKSVAWPDIEFNGEVVAVDTRVDPISRTVSVRALVPNDEGRLRPGMFLTVRLLKSDEVGLMIPEGSVVPEQSIQYVFTVDDAGMVSKKQVELGRRRPGEVEVLGGLEEGERVVSEGTQKVRDGATVEVVEASS